MKVLVATDGGDAGTAAIDAIRTLRLGENDEIKVLCVVDMAVPFAVDIYGAYLPETPELEKAARENASKVVSDAEELVNSFFQQSRPHVSTEILFGTPESRIVETAEQIGADMIVIGSHGYKAWERLLLGSVSNSVIHHAPCSVLVVRAKTK